MLSRRDFLRATALSAAGLASATNSATALTTGNGVPFQIPPRLQSRVVDTALSAPAGELHLFRDTNTLYYTLGDGRAIAYTVGLGQAGMQWDDTLIIRRKEQWPSWTPTANMIRRDPDLYGPYADGMPGGPDNPLGTRALYLFRNGRDTLYRIHGTPQPWTVGENTSNGCVRMYNSDVIELYSRVALGTKVVPH